MLNGLSLLVCLPPPRGVPQPVLQTWSSCGDVRKPEFLSERLHQNGSRISFGYFVCPGLLCAGRRSVFGGSELLEVLDALGPLAGET